MDMTNWDPEVYFRDGRMTAWPVDGRGRALKCLPRALYRAYIESEDWRDVRARYRASRLPKCCVACGATTGLELHHATYERLGRERLTDLRPLCGDCHERVHASFDRRDGIGSRRRSLWCTTQRCDEEEEEEEERRNSFRFVYAWHDRRHGKYYIGSHMGKVDDGYVCISKSMNKAYAESPGRLRAVHTRMA